MKLFIGSTSEQLQLAKDIAAALVKQGFHIYRWWTSFRPGDVTLERLQEIVKEVDGGIFLLDAADKAICRGAETGIPRDNLILEYGLFLQEHGKHHCYLLVDDTCKLPSDIAGLTYARVLPDAEAMADEIAKHFKSLKLTYRTTYASSLSIPIICEDSLLDIELGKRYNDKFRMRSIYLGSEGAKGWLELVSGNDYEYVAEKNKIKNSAARIIKKAMVSYNTMISLGPGDGEIEKAIVQSDTARECKFFIPVDINEYLLKLTVRQVHRHIHVPFGLQCDFEDGFDFLERAIIPLLSDANLFVMMGNTFGNLDNAETPFLRNLMRLMHSGDYFLLEVAARKTMTPSESPANIKEEDSATIHLLINGLAYHTKKSYEYLKENIYSYITKDIIQGLSDIDNTETVVYLDQSKNPLAFSRRYSREDILEYLKNNGMEIIMNQTIPHNDIIENLILLVRKGL